MATTDMTKYAENAGQRPLLAMLSDDRVMKRFEQACGQKAGAVVVNIVNAANLNPEIYECEPPSVITAALNAATINLSLAPGLGQAAILPFKKNKKVGNEWVTTKRAQLVIMVRGVKELAMRSNKYRVLNPFKVFEGQEVEEDQMTGRMKIIGKPISDKIIGHGAYLLLVNGYEAFVYWTVEKILEHAKRYSPTWDNQKKEFNSKSRWVTHFDEQCEKTVVKDLIMNHGVISEGDRAMLNKIDDEREGATLVRPIEEDEPEPARISAPAPRDAAKEAKMAEAVGGSLDLFRADSPEIVGKVADVGGVDMSEAQAWLFTQYKPGDLLALTDAAKFAEIYAENNPAEVEQPPLMSE